MIKLGKVVYRNIQEQVAKNTDDIGKLWKRPIFQIKVVEELPEEGEASVLYLLPVEDPEEGNYYDEYLWIDGAWELVGSTAVDISNMVTTDTEQTITGEKKLSFDLNPTDSNTYDLGSSSYKWKDIYLAGSAYLGTSGTTYINTDAYNGVAININNSTKFLIREGTTYINNNLYPLSDGTRDIGTNGASFKNIYLSGDINIGSGKIWYNGSLFVNDDLSPSNSSISLGKTSYPWNDLHLGGSVYVENAATVYSKSGGSPAISFTINPWYIYAYNIAPIAENSSSGNYLLGGSSRRWGTIYGVDANISGNITDGANSVSVADLAALITYAKAQGWIS